MSQQPIHWKPTLESAQHLAGQTNRLVLIQFWAPWCVICRQMEMEVLSQPAVVSVLNERYVPVKVNADNSVTYDGDPIEINHIQRLTEDRLMANAKLVVLLEIHPEADYGLMVACLDELRLANATRVSLKTTE